MLGEHGNSEFSTSVLGSFSDVEVIHDQVNQSGFSSSIGTNDGKSGVLVDGEIEVLEDELVLRITELSILNFHERWHNFFWGLEDESARWVRKNLLNKIHLFQHLNSTLYECGSLGIGSEFFNELLHVLDFFLLELVLFLLKGSQFVSGFFELVVVTSIVDQLLLIEMDDFFTGLIQELSGVGDNDNGNIRIRNEILQPQDSL